ncbi:MAG: YhgE/Pip domain-containing protein [Lachnospiraceae bacterium]|nr:YhgE/Pip domain-containing protein [Lachnospiraceae bacterium]
MRNIFKIFMADARRILTNVVGVVVIIGLSVIPCLYSWFNILSNWDPYVESATSKLSVAVASDDMGISIDDLEVNVGDKIIANLKENSTINWVFPDTSEDAINGVYSGEYYAALVVNDSFSEDIISFLGGNIVHPKISYYENQKKNAIAPKITDKVQSTVQEEVNSAFVSTIAKVLLEASEFVVADEHETSLTDSAIEKMQDLDSDLTTVITILDSFISLTDSTNAVMDAASEITDELDAMKDTAKSMTDVAKTTADTTKSAIDTSSDMVNSSVEQVKGQLKSLDALIGDLTNSITVNTEVTDAQIKSLITTNEAIKQAYDLGVKRIRDVNPVIAEDANKVDSDFDKVSQDLQAVMDATDKTAADIPAKLKDAQNNINACKSSIETMAKDYDNSVKPQLKTSISNIKNSLTEVKNLLNYSSDSINDLAAILDSYPDLMNVGKGNLASSRAEVAKMQTELRDLIKDMQDLEANDQYQLLVKLIETDPAIIADFIAEPVGINTQPIYPIENNGSAMAAFYIVLSIWLGGLILVAILNTKVLPMPELKNVKKYQEFFGRYITFFLVGQIQTNIIVFGCIFYVNMQCVHPVLFWLACSVMSMSFTFFMYSFVYAFGSVGLATCVILLVVQVAGTGGTFPVEVLPMVFQIIYKYMPFAHGMKIVRECIAGMYELDYLWAMLGLIAYMGVSFLVGLIGMKAKRFEEFIERKIEEQDVIG